MEKSEFLGLTKHYYLMGENAIQAKQWLDKCYPDSASSRKMVERWFVDLKRSRTNTDDAERSGRPNSAVVLEIIKKSPQNGFFRP